jgi:hypothetical protein
MREGWHSEVAWQMAGCQSPQLVVIRKVGPISKHSEHGAEARIKSEIAGIDDIGV